MGKLYWQITGFDSSKKFFETRVDLGQFTETQIQQLLKTLVAKAGLEYREIIGAYAKRKTKIANNYLVVRREHGFLGFVCGNNPHFVAAVVDQSGKVMRPRKLS